MLLADGLDLFVVALVQALEDVIENLIEHVEDFMVMVLEAHLHVAAGELAQMTMGKRLLGAEDGADLENAVQIAHKSHLLVKLGRLGEVSVISEVVGELENVSTAFGGGGDQPNTKSRFWSNKNLNFGAKKKIWGFWMLAISNF